MTAHFHGEREHLTLFGERLHALEPDVYAVMYPHPVSAQGVAEIQRTWRRVMGPNKKLIVIDRGGVIARLDNEPTPIYDELLAEMQPSAL